MSDDNGRQLLQHIRWDGKLNLVACAFLAASDHFIPPWASTVVFITAIWPLPVSFNYPWHLLHDFVVPICAVWFTGSFLYSYCTVQVIEAILFYTACARDDAVFPGITKTCAENRRRRQRVLTEWALLYACVVWAVRHDSFWTSILAVGLATTALFGPDNRSYTHRLEEILAGSGLSRSAWRAPNFQYTRLQNPRNIRLLILPTFKPYMYIYFFDTLFSMELIEVSLDRNPGKYAPISHRWKESSQFRTVSVNGHSVKIPLHMYHMMGRVSDIYPRVIWVDSICIDQQNDNEKSEQVPLMRDIYQQGFRVHGYIDMPILSGWRAIALVMLVNKFQDGDLPSFQGSVLSSWYFRACWDSICALYSDEFFTRVWIIQEVVLAKNFDIYCGSFAIMWLIDLIRFTQHLDSNPQLQLLMIEGQTANHDKLHAVLAGMRNFRIQVSMRSAFQSNKPRSALSTFCLSVGFSATDPRDNIYGLLGLFPKSIDPPPRPDYSRGTSAVLLEYCLWMMRVARQEDRLAHLHFSGVGMARNIGGLPSWVPDWTVAGEWALSLGEARGFHASSYTRHRLHTSSSQRMPLQDRLHLRGYLVDRVKLVISLSPDLIQNQRIPLIGSSLTDGDREHLASIANTHLQPIQEALTTAQANFHDPYRTGQSAAESFWRTLLADSDLKGGNASRVIIDAYQAQVEGLKTIKTLPRLRSMGVGGLQTLLQQKQLSGNGQPNIMERLHQESARAVKEYVASLSQPARQALAKELAKAGVILPEDWLRSPRTESPTKLETSGRGHSIAKYWELLPKGDEGKYRLFQAKRAFCITESGSMGLTPALSRPGDEVAIVFGLNTPCLLRRKGGPSSEYEFVGTCYVHGIMDGEIMGKGFEEEFILT